MWQHVPSSCPLFIGQCSGLSTKSKGSPYVHCDLLTTFNQQHCRWLAKADDQSITSNIGHWLHNLRQYAKNGMYNSEQDVEHVKGKEGQCESRFLWRPWYDAACSVTIPMNDGKQPSYNTKVSEGGDFINDPAFQQRYAEFWTTIGSSRKENNCIGIWLHNQRQKACKGRSTGRRHTLRII